jgi:hypothetical protein
MPTPIYRCIYHPAAQMSHETIKCYDFLLGAPKKQQKHPLLPRKGSKRGLNSLRSLAFSNSYNIHMEEILLSNLDQRKILSCYCVVAFQSLLITTSRKTIDRCQAVHSNRVSLCRKPAKSFFFGNSASQAAISIIEFYWDKWRLDKKIALLHYFGIVQLCKAASRSCRNFVLFNVDIGIAMQ